MRGKEVAATPVRRSGSVAVLCLVQFVDVLGVMVMVTALPAIVTGLDAPASSVAPLVAGYPMFFGGLLMVGARLGDRHGHRRVLLLGLIGFGAASLLAAMAASVPVLVAARCAQGAASAVSVPAALRLLTAATSDSNRSRRRALAAWSATGAAAGVSGYLVGGLLTDLIGWRSIFWINLPLAAMLVIAVQATVRRLPRDDVEGLGLLGAVLLTSSVMGLVLGSSLLEQQDQRLLGLAVVLVGVALLGGFILVERRASDPLIPPAALRSQHLRLGLSASLLNTATTSSAMTLAALHLQDERGLSPSAAALWLLPCSLGVILGSTLAAPLLRQRSPWMIITWGLMLIATGVASLLALRVAEMLLPVAVAVAGLGIGLTSVAANVVGIDVRPELQGTAAGALNTAAQLGTALGVAGLFLVAGLTRDTDLPLRGTPLAWAASAALAGIAATSIFRSGTRATGQPHRNSNNLHQVPLPGRSNTP